jgi:glutathione S-transferase
LRAVFRLHYIPGSAAMAPHAALAEAGAEYELVPVEREDGKAGPEYLKLSPFGLVPALEDGDRVITESTAIMLHIAERFPDARLVPPVATDERTEVYRWLGYFSYSVQPSMIRWIYPERYTTDPGGTAGIRAREDAFLREHLAWIDGELAGRSYLVGDERTVSDLFLFMLTRWGRHQAPPWWDSPRVRDHFQRLLELDGVRRMMDEQGLQVPPL